MPDFYPQEKGVIKRDRTGEARDILAKELMYESLGMIPVGGMAAKMSKPAVDVLGRWIRRFRKDKPPTVPLKNIEKALRHEGIRRGLGTPPRSWEHSAERIYRDPPIQLRRFEPTFRSGAAPDFSGADRYIGFKEKPEFDMLHDFRTFLEESTEQERREFLNRIGRRR